MPRYGGADGVTMKSRTSFGDFMPKNEGVPGPGQYSQDMRGIKGGHGGSAIGAGQRGDLVGNGMKTPGPGSHNTTNWDTASRQGAGSTFGPKDHVVKSDRGKDLIINAKNPGPGSYNVGGRNSLNAPSYSMSGAKYDKDLSYAPGPGAYVPNFSNKGDDRASLIGNGARSAISVGKKGPGPGAYNPAGAHGGSL